MRLLLTISLTVLILGISLAETAKTQESYGPMSSNDVATMPEGDRSMLRHPQALTALTEVQGRVESIDAAARQLRITDSEGNPVVVQIHPETQINAPTNRDMKLTELKPADQVRVYYNRADGSAQQVDRLPSPRGILLGID